MKPRIERHAAAMRLKSVGERARRFKQGVKVRVGLGAITEREARQLVTEFWEQVRADIALSKGIAR